MEIAENIKRLVKEAVTTNTIQEITLDERREIAALAWQINMQHLNAYCDGCIIQACYLIDHYSHGQEHINKNPKRGKKTFNNQNK